MITCYLMGGLGNQLFQIFCVISNSIEYKTPFWFSDKKQLGEFEQGITVRYTYWDTFLKSLKPFIKSIDYNNNMNIIREQGFHYSKLNIDLQNNDNILLYGYFQSPSYFEKHKFQIFKLIRLNQNKEAVNKLYLNTINSNFNFNEVISLHFRIGDYVKYPDSHPILNLEYYKKAITYILNNTKKSINTVLYFFEKNDINDVTNNINYLKEEFPQITFIPVFNEIQNHNFSDWEEMLLMSLCQHNIIANSSFSWWGAYFNENQDNIICYPSIWFGKNLKHNNLENLFPKTWIKIIH
jgi:hypothetical protein